MMVKVSGIDRHKKIQELFQKNPVKTQWEMKFLMLTSKSLLLTQMVTYF